QRLLLLAYRLHLADPAEERIARLVDAEGKAEIACNRLCTDHPAIAEGRDVIGRADADIFAHPERLQPVEMTRRLAAEAIRRHVEAQAAPGQRAAAGGNRINGIAGGRR